MTLASPSLRDRLFFFSGAFQRHDCHRQGELIQTKQMISSFDTVSLPVSASSSSSSSEVKAQNQRIRTQLNKLASVLIVIDKTRRETEAANQSLLNGLSGTT